MSDAGHQLSDRVLALADRLRRREEDPGEESEKPTAWVSFEAGGHKLALPVTHVEGVHRVAEIAALPQTPPSVRGVMNIRGRVLAVIDLGTHMGLEPVAIGPDCRVLLSRFDGRALGLLVDRALGVVKVRASQIEPAAESTDEVAPACSTLGIVPGDPDPVLLIDPDQLLDGELPEPAS